MQLVISLFIFVCLAMIVYTIAANYADLYQINKKEKMERHYLSAIQKEYTRLSEEKSVSRTHQEELEQTLTAITPLMAFEQALSQKKKDDQNLYRRYRQILPAIFGELVPEYQKKEEEEQTYFAYVVGKFQLSSPTSQRAIASFMLELTKSKSLYCRKNAFQALSLSGHDHGVIQGLKNLSRKKEYLSLKLITEELLKIPKENTHFSKELLQEFSKFSSEIKVAILNYYALSGVATPEEVLHIYNTEDNKEVHLACLRFLGKYPSVEGKKILLSFVEEYNNPKWEYVSTAAFGLSHYIEKEVVMYLKEALHSKYWHVRYNAAYSLATMQHAFPCIKEIENKSDTFAKEILAYHLNQQKKKEAHT